MSTIASPPVRLDEQGIAWITGTTTKVVEVVLAQRVSGDTPEDLQANLPHLTLPQIEAALAYYKAHHGTLDALIERQREEVEQVRAKTPPVNTRTELEERLERRRKATG